MNESARPSRANTVVVWNPRAGKADSSTAVREDLESRSGVRVVEAVQRPEVSAAVQSAADAGAERIYVAGGDGTVSAAAEGLISTGLDIPLGVIPTGTGNDLCRTLGIPLDPSEALEVLESAPLERIDLVEMVDGSAAHFFINMATAGNSDRVIGQIGEEQKHRWGPLSYLLGALDVARDLITYAITVHRVGEPPEHFRIWNILLANGRTSGGGIPVAPRANPADGLFDLIIVKEGTLPNLLEIGLRLWTDTVLESDLVVHRPATSLTIDADPPLRFTADGDLVEWVPVEFRITPGAIAMPVGPTFAGWDTPSEPF